MKKLLLFVVLASCGFTKVQSQMINLEMNYAQVDGDIADRYILGMQMHAGYFRSVNEVFSGGFTAGYTVHQGDYSYKIGDTRVEVDDVKFITFGPSIYFKPGLFFLGADIGYAAPLHETSENGIPFFYRPKIGMTFGGAFGALISYSGVMLKGGTFNSINYGLTVFLD